MFNPSGITDVMLCYVSSTVLIVILFICVSILKYVSFFKVVIVAFEFANYMDV